MSATHLATVGDVWDVVVALAKVNKVSVVKYPSTGGFMGLDSPLLQKKLINKSDPTICLMVFKVPANGLRSVGEAVPSTSIDFCSPKWGYRRFWRTDHVIVRFCWK